ncbi:hypothetical protein U14_00334 [Candidatus Moduliflexus flocculans]|uniref:PilZ domain-containing protein n=1 Tax=Candidatus Moduliflexus flocculans TaxID=1499966 RepID=A0A0S6VU19_9BACT|nr:hypothetical protein U14_00334 [Candidatus Moduliflexus flocculans]
MGEEKRRYPRVPVNAFVRFYEEIRVSRKYLHGIIKNYSRGGMFIGTKHLLAKGTIVTVEIPLETEDEQLAIVQVRGFVRRVQDMPGSEGIGLEFFELRDGEHEIFQKWMNSLSH